MTEANQKWFPFVQNVPMLMRKKVYIRQKGSKCIHIFTPKRPKLIAVKASHIHVAQIREYLPESYVTLQITTETDRLTLRLDIRHYSRQR